MAIFQIKPWYSALIFHWHCRQSLDIHGTG